MTAACVECGAPNGMCEERFYYFLELEFTYPDFGAVHHLTVAAYMLQHPSRLSRAGWLAMRELLNQFIAQGLSPAAVRARQQRELDNRHGAWSLTRGPRLDVPVGFTWSETILNVDDTQVSAYCQTVKCWARQVLNEAGKISDIR